MPCCCWCAAAPAFPAIPSCTLSCHAACTQDVLCTLLHTLLPRCMAGGMHHACLYHTCHHYQSDATHHNQGAGACSWLEAVWAVQRVLNITPQQRTTMVKIHELVCSAHQLPIAGPYCAPTTHSACSSQCCNTAGHDHGIYSLHGAVWHMISRGHD